MRLVITMPVFDDWQAAYLLCIALDEVLQTIPNVSCSVLMIDDGSVTPAGQTFGALRPSALKQLMLLRLRRNLGHQRAIAIGLAYIQEHLPSDAVVVMDADGQDRPEDIPRLIERLRASQSPVTVFAQRGRRFEGLTFRAFYLAYRLLHYVLTGRGISFGNYSILPVEHLNSLVCYPQLWNHYAATIVNSRLPWATVWADRGQRLQGRSRMNFVSLVVHGASALFAYQAVVSTRILIGSAFVSALFCFCIAAIVLMRIYAPFVIPGWTTLMIGLFCILIVQVLSASLILVFFGMNTRSNLEFLPVRDYRYFVDACVNIEYK